QLAAGAVGRDLVRRRADRADLEPALVVGGEGGAQVPLGDAGRELGVEPVGVGVPQLDLRPGQRPAVGGSDLAGPHQGSAPLVVAGGHRAAGALLGGAGHVVRTLDGALAAFAVPGGHVFDDVFHP